MPIPKVIHYCWFGRNPLPEKALACIASWEKFCPNYEIKQWNEDSFDFSGNRYAREAYEAKKWAFVSDYARLAVLYEQGGIYMDTDVEVIRPLDEFLAEDAFSGFEGPWRVAAGIMGAQAGHPWIKSIQGLYEDRPFMRNDGTLDMTPITDITTDWMEQACGLVRNGTAQTLRDHVRIFPSDWFYPRGWESDALCMTENTHTIHHYAGSWSDPAGQRFQARFRRLMPIFGKKAAFGLAYLYTGFEKHGLMKGAKIAAGRLLGRGK